MLSSYCLFCSKLYACTRCFSLLFVQIILRSSCCVGSLRKLDEQPEWLKGGKLRDYQLEGLNFLVNRYKLLTFGSQATFVFSFVVAQDWCQFFSFVAVFGSADHDDPWCLILSWSIFLCMYLFVLSWNRLEYSVRTFCDRTTFVCGLQFFFFLLPSRFLRVIIARHMLECGQEYVIVVTIPFSLCFAISKHVLSILLMFGWAYNVLDSRLYTKLHQERLFWILQSNVSLCFRCLVFYIFIFFT